MPSLPPAERKRELESYRAPYLRCVNSRQPQEAIGSLILKAVTSRVLKRKEKGPLFRGPFSFRCPVATGCHARFNLLQLSEPRSGGSEFGTNNISAA